MNLQTYDANFAINGLACVVIEAENQEAAFEEAEKVLENMSKEEIIERLTDAFNFGGVYVESVTET